MTGNIKLKVKMDLVPLFDIGIGSSGKRSWKIFQMINFS